MTRQPFVPLIPQDAQLLEGIKDVRVCSCMRCGRVQRLKRWIKTPITTEIESKIRGLLMPNRQAKIKKIAVELSPIVEDAKTVHAVVQVSGSVDGQTLAQEYDVEVRLIKELCQLCNKNKEEYYEGVLQLRNIPDSVLDFAIGLVRNLEDRGVFANRVDKITTGYDVYISNQKVMKTLANDLQKKFGGTVQNDEKLFSFDSLTSKDLFRVNITYTGFIFSRGDIITHIGEPFLVESTGREATLRSLVTNQLTKIDAIIAKDYEVAKLHKLEVIKVKPQVHVLDATHYQELVLENAPADLVIGSQVNAFLFNGRAYAKHI